MQLLFNKLTPVEFYLNDIGKNKYVLFPFLTYRVTAAEIYDINLNTFQEAVIMACKSYSNAPRVGIIEKISQDFQMEKELIRIIINELNEMKLIDDELILSSAGRSIIDKAEQFYVSEQKRMAIRLYQDIFSGNLLRRYSDKPPKFVETDEQEGKPYPPVQIKDRSVMPHWIFPSNSMPLPIRPSQEELEKAIMGYNEDKRMWDSDFPTIKSSESIWPSERTIRPIAEDPEATYLLSYLYFKGGEWYIKDPFGLGASEMLKDVYSKGEANKKLKDTLEYAKKQNQTKDGKYENDLNRETEKYMSQEFKLDSESDCNNYRVIFEYYKAKIRYERGKHIGNIRQVTNEACSVMETCMKYMIEHDFALYRKGNFKKLARLKDNLTIRKIIIDSAKKAELNIEDAKELEEFLYWHNGNHLIIDLNTVTNGQLRSLITSSLIAISNGDTLFLKFLRDTPGFIDIAGTMLKSRDVHDCTNEVKRRKENMVTANYDKIKDCMDSLILFYLTQSVKKGV